jgi:hypothetical protein
VTGSGLVVDATEPFTTTLVNKGLLADNVDVPWYILAIRLLGVVLTTETVPETDCVVGKFDTETTPETDCVVGKLDTETDPETD